jgi:murein DD-endopeptidase MepM/ murein hydrolase activator NlpD
MICAYAIHVFQHSVQRKDDKNSVLTARLTYRNADGCPTHRYYYDIWGTGMAEQKEKRNWRDRLRVKYRMVVMNDETFEERVSLRLTPLGILVLLSAITIVMTTLLVSLVAFTPIREYIPGYADVNMRRDLYTLKVKADSLELVEKNRAVYLENLKIVLTGADSAGTIVVPRDTTSNYDNIDFRPSKEDSLLRAEIEAMNEKYALELGGVKRGGIAGFFFFAPIRGTVTSSFNPREEHLGTDIAAEENEAVKAALDGTVLSSSWSVEDGHVVMIQHANNLVTVYKHNAAVLKKNGQYVKAGEPIAIVGNTGENSTGPHLHFEVWYNGAPVDPQDYVTF